MLSDLAKLNKLQDERYLNPSRGVTKDYQQTYKKNQPIDNFLKTSPKNPLARINTLAIIGLMLGDEGKGRIVDNKLKEWQKKKSLKKIFVVRFQGGSNSGHTIEKDNLRLALHQVPSAILYDNTIGIMDSGMVIHPLDLQTEILDAEKHVGSLKNKLILSRDAILCTDLERAEEVLNRLKEGKSMGGTGRGIGPTYAHHYDKLGLHVFDLISDDWLNIFSRAYDRYEKEFNAYGLSLKNMDVPDLKEIRKQKKAVAKKVGSKKEYLAKLKEVRDWLIKRKIIQNTYLIHKEKSQDLKNAFIFEGAQAIGLHPWLGTRPDVTSSDTSINGVAISTKYWRAQDVEKVIGVFKLTYTSSVGARIMPTKAVNGWSGWVQKYAHEFGTTTGRPRDILYLDLPMMTYNLHMSGVHELAGTHLDVSRIKDKILICTHYTKNGKEIHYQPGLTYLKGVTPNYLELPGWDGEETVKAKKFSQLPINAQKYLVFLQRRTGYPIKLITTGPDRKNVLSI